MNQLLGSEGVEGDGAVGAGREGVGPFFGLAKVLVDRGIEARVDGAVRPFRVRIGRYETRADAVKALATLKNQGHAGFVTMVQER